MYKIQIFNVILISLLVLSSCESPPPIPESPIPTPQQIAWHEMEFYAFVHFNMNTFTNMEWGMGDEKPMQFDPSNLDCRQWARVCRDAGMKGIILTAKHHDGFCLWPSKYTEHSVKNAPWKNGQGDVVQDLKDACDEFGLKLGIYYSPWDRNHKDYGNPEYLSYMHNQLKELLTQYGEIFEVWFDGANGGTGYYGGANEAHKVDKKTYYDWKNTWDLVHKWQPNALIFSDAGPDVRWVGNEEGYAFETMWSNLVRDSVYPGMVEYSKLYASGQEYGTHFVPGETNVSIRPGWYYHPYEDHRVRSLHELVEMYYNSIGRNTTWLLNFPVDDRGLIHEKDVAQLAKLTAKIKEDFKENLISEAQVVASNERGAGFAASNITDKDLKSYWATEDGTTHATLEISLNKFTELNRVLLQEHIALGQRIKNFTIEAHTEKGWKTAAEATTIGYKRIVRIKDVLADKIRIEIKASKGPPTLSNIEVYNAPKLVIPPMIQRDNSGVVTITVPEEGIDIFYTLDEGQPTSNSVKYDKPFIIEKPTIVKAMASDGKKSSEVALVTFDIPTANWSTMSPHKEAALMMDEDPNTYWKAENMQSASIDLGSNYTITGFSYLPSQGRWDLGYIDNYKFYTSKNGTNWQLAKTGEFSNIKNSPIRQEIKIPKTKARYIRLEPVSTVDDTPATFAEFGVITR